MNVTDQLNFAHEGEVQRLAFRILDQIQNEAGGRQIAASGLLFLLICERFKADPRYALDKAALILAECFKQNGEQVRAIKTYLEKEL